MLIRFLSVGKIKYFFESDHDIVTLVDFIAAYCVIGVKCLQCMSGLLNFLQEIVLFQASSDFKGTKYATIGIRAFFARGVGVVNHLPKKFLQVAQIFTKQSKGNEGHTMH